METSGELTETNSPWRKPGLRGSLEAIGDVFRGIWYMFRTQKPFRLQLAASGLYAAMAAWRGISLAEWVISAIVIALILAFETVNTAVEQMCDLIDRRYNPTIGIAKDLAAGAVGIVVLVALLVGLIFVIWPKLI